MAKQNLKRLFDAARKGTLPPDFTGWALADNDGRTVAHEAARFGPLPADMDRAVYKLADYYGWTVAHNAALYGYLPPDFTDWALADNTGWTVAHMAALFGHLPSDFERWDMVDGDGRTVAEIAAANHNGCREKNRTSEKAENEESGPRP
jgi:ankyrin repeat protein